jgi:hypothetical protein
MTPCPCSYGSPWLRARNQASPESLTPRTMTRVERDGDRQAARFPEGFSDRIRPVCGRSCDFRRFAGRNRRAPIRGGRAGDAASAVFPARAADETCGVKARRRPSDHAGAPTCTSRSGRAKDRRPARSATGASGKDRAAGPAEVISSHSRHRPERTLPNLQSRLRPSAAAYLWSPTTDGVSR